jgi:exopolysaccharide biosynthesis protein
VSDDALIAVACDGRRTGVDAGLTMVELAEVLLGLGARDAINLDGGGSTTLVHRGHLLNRPYSSQDQPAPQSRRVVSALAFSPDRRTGR